MNFTSDEWRILTDTLMRKTAADCDNFRAVSAQNLADEATWAQLLQYLTPLLGSPNLAIAASLFRKRLAFLATGVCL